MKPFKNLLEDKLFTEITLSLFILFLALRILQFENFGKNSVLVVSVVAVIVLLLVSVIEMKIFRRLNASISGGKRPHKNNSYITSKNSQFNEFVFNAGFYGRLLTYVATLLALFLFNHLKGSFWKQMVWVGLIAFFIAVLGFMVFRFIWLFNRRKSM